MNNFMINSSANKRANTLLGLIVIFGSVSIPALLLPFQEPVQIQGITQAVDTDTITASFDGNIESIIYYKNEMVKKGDPLYKLESSQYREEAINTYVRLSVLINQLTCASSAIKKLDYPLDKKAIEILKKIEKSIDMIEHRPTELFCQEYATSRLNVAKSTAEEKEGELARLIGLSNDFKLEIGVQKRMLDRYKHAVNAGAISALQYEQALREYLKSLKDLNETMATIKVARHQLQQAKINQLEQKSGLMLKFYDIIDDNLKNLAINIEKTKKFPQFDHNTYLNKNDTRSYIIRAGKNGIVDGQQNFKTGDFVKSGQILANITNPSTSVFIIGQASALERKKIIIGSQVKVTYISPSTGALVKLDGTVSGVSATSNRGSGILTNPEADLSSQENKTITYPIAISLNSDTKSKEDINRAQLIPGERVGATIKGPRTNLLLTLIRPLRERLTGI